MSQLDELRRRIAQAAASYWDTGISPISDEEYDRLVEKLRALTGEEDIIGAPKVLSSGKVEHPADRPMLSMRKTYDLNDVVRWAMKYAPGLDLIVMPKYDGIALCHYDSGVIATRGDGRVGEDATQVASCFVLDKWGYGEAVCRIDDFDRIMKPLGYKNPRNAVSGILSSLDPKIQKRAKYLTFVLYRSQFRSVSGWRPASSDPLAQEDEFRRLAHDLRFAQKQMTVLDGIYPMDGIVVRIADDDAFYALGHTDHHWRGQIALKFANESAETIIEQIQWQEKNGTITPVAILAPVSLGGAEICHVTLHNADWVRARDVRVGDGCRIERAGGVIPKLVVSWRREQSGPRIVPPTTCPTCGYPLSVSGARLFCARCDK